MFVKQTFSGHAVFIPLIDALCGVVGSYLKGLAGLGGVLENFAENFDGNGCVRAEFGRAGEVADVLTAICFFLHSSVTILYCSSIHERMPAWAPAFFSFLSCFGYVSTHFLYKGKKMPPKKQPSSLGAQIRISDKEKRPLLCF